LTCKKKKHFYELSGIKKDGFDPLKPGSIKKIIKKKTQKLGNCIPFKEIPVGTFVFNIHNKKEKISLSAGCFAVILQKNKKICRIKLPSNKIKDFPIKNFAVIGRCNNINHHLKNFEKAGRSRWLGIRPTVRGVAKNPVDHPNGGGEGKKVGKLSPWGKKKGISSLRKTIRAF